MKRWVFSLFLLVVVSAYADSTIPLMFQRKELAKAEPDGCFFDIGDTNNYFMPTGIDCQDCIDAGGQPKVNQAYVWGLTRCEDDLWFGTGPNVNALVAGEYMRSTNPSLRGSRVQEFYLSEFARAGLVKGELGDWRPPDIFVYTLQDGPLVRLDESFSASASNLLWQTVGLRSAGTSAPNTTHSNGVVILAGPSLTATSGGGIVMFAFDGASRTLIDARRFTAYTNIRKWLLHDGVLYTAVTTPDGDGYVLRWLNDPAHDDYPLAFDVVGNLNNGGAELAYHDGRLFVGTWPGLEGQQDIDILELLTEPGGIFMSPEVPPGGLTLSHANDWQIFWDITDYEVDQVCAAVTGVGALHSFGGYLYWGTMHVPLLNNYAHTIYHGPPTNYPGQDQEQLWNSWRAIEIFRATDFQEGFWVFPASADVELLYGETNLPSRHLTTHEWSAFPNASGMAPLYGSSGFGNYGNNYTWTMAVHEDMLYVGTMDNYGLYQWAPRETDGANLFCFPSATEPARTVSHRGVGNSASYGIRTILSDSNYLYLGMANPQNLLTDTNDSLPEGGWELIRLEKTFDDIDWDDLPDAWETVYYGGPTNGLPDSHDDADPFDARSEFIAGTDPFDGSDGLWITQAVRGAESGTNALSWAGASNRVYRALRAADLSGPWQSIGAVTGTGAAIHFPLPDTSERTRFYRIQAALPPGPLP